MNFLVFRSYGTALWNLELHIAHIELNTYMECSIEFIE
jgi:hypothetical protein